jgi:hypothetical protein
MIDDYQASLIKGLLARGDRQQDIAAFFGENSGRIAEVSTGQTFPHVAPMAEKHLPSRDQVAGKFAMFFAEQAIKRAQRGLADALEYLAEHQEMVAPRRKP